jgi:hypothetical protein
MKLNLLPFYFLLFLSLNISAQNPQYPAKHDAVWVGGYGSWANEAIYGGHAINFQQFPAIVSYEYLDMEFGNNIAVICNEEGDLQFYTNGEYIANFTGEIMENGDDINPDESDDQTTNYQVSMILPMPEHNNEYILIHKEREWVAVNGNDLDGLWTANFKTYYSYVDMNANGGLGSVLEKNVEILDDTLNYGRLTAAKHANGRDWWLLLPEYWSNHFYRFLISPNGIDTLEKQTVIGLDEPARPGLGQAVFSPDGTKYIVSGSKSTPEGVHLDIYDFNRCTGLLSNPQRRFFEENNTFGKPVIVSPNSRFLYFALNGWYYQYDLWAEDIIGSETELQFYDGYISPFFDTYPWLGQLGLDGNIYIATTSATDVMHIIHDPDFPEEASRLEQHGIQLPRLNNGTIANHPHYRLGPIDGSSCDTLGIDNFPIANFRHETFTDAVHFRDLSAGAPNDWYWTFGDGESSSEKHNNHIYDSGGLYEVCLTVSNQNGSDTWCDSVQILTTSAVEQQELSIESSIFPNPSEGLVLLQTEQNLPPDSHFKVYDQAGRLVFDKELQSGFDKQNIEMYNLSNGMYFYEILLSDFVIGKGKLVISR